MRTLILPVLLVFVFVSSFCPLYAEEEEQEEHAEFGKPKIDMAPFHLSLINRGKVEGMVTIQLTLVIEKQGSYEDVRLRLPQIRSDFNTALTVLAQQRFSITRPINPDMVKAYLTPYAVRRLGQKVVSVYVEQALIEPA